MQLVQKHHKHKHLTTRKCVYVFVQRQEVAGGIADVATVHCDNKGKGGARPFILFGLESGSAIVSLTPW